MNKAKTRNVNLAICYAFLQYFKSQINVVTFAIRLNYLGSSYSVLAAIGSLYLAEYKKEIERNRKGKT